MGRAAVAYLTGATRLALVGRKSRECLAGWKGDSLMSPSPIGHFDEVEILDTPATRQLEISGERGIVVGVSQENDEPFLAVAIDAFGRTVMLSATDVRATGRRVQRDQIYDGTSINVTEQGHVVIEPDDNE